MDKMKNKFKPVIVELRPSKITPKGVGVFAITKMKKYTKVFEGIHMEDFKHMISWEEYRKLPKLTQQKIIAFCVGTPQGFVPPDNLDFNSLSIEWYLNHSCEGNVGFNNRGDFVTIKNIKSGDELTYDYRLVESNPKFKMQCSCGTSKCSKLITGVDWKLLTNNPKKFQFMHPYLKKTSN